MRRAAAVRERVRAGGVEERYRHDRQYARRAGMQGKWRMYGSDGPLAWPAT